MIINQSGPALEIFQCEQEFTITDRCLIEEQNSCFPNSWTISTNRWRTHIIQSNRYSWQLHAKILELFPFAVLEFLGLYKLALLGLPQAFFSERCSPFCAGGAIAVWQSSLALLPWLYPA